MRKKTHDQFISEMTIANPSVLVLGTYVNSSTKIEVRCVNCNHVWSAVPDSLAHGHGCPVCAGNQRKTSQQFVSEMHTLNPFVEILGEYETAVTPLKVRCTICGYEWLSKPNRLLRGAQCTNCIKPHTSFMEQFILLAFQQTVGENIVVSRDTSAIGLELDIFVPTLNLAIEPGSWLYHKTKAATIDLQKRSACKRAGIRLITVYDTYPPDTAPPFENDCYVFDGFLNEPGYKRIIAFLKKLMDDYNIKCGGIDWNQIASRAYAACHYNAHEMFVQHLAQKYPNIEVLEEYKGTNIPIEVNDKTCPHSSWMARPYTLAKGIGCPECGKIIAVQNRTRTHGQFVAKMAQIAPTIEIIGEYTKAAERIGVRCKVCGHEWNPLCYSLLSGKGCSHCSAIRASKQRSNKLAKKTTKQFEEELSAKNRSILVLGEYINNKTKIPVRCTICGHTWDVVPASLLNGHGCPVCSRKRRQNG